MNNLFKYGFSVILGIGLVACSGKTGLDSPSQGTITIAADESFKPLVQQLTEAYSAIYPRAHFNVVYRPEQEAITMMLRDQARMVVTARPLIADEQAILSQRKIPGKTQRIAIDGVALIINKANTDSLITLSQLQGLFNGSLKQWSQLKGGSQTGPVTLVFDSNNSSNLSYALRKFKISTTNGVRIFTTKSNEQVIDYVRQNPSALGFIGVNWISDGDSPLTARLSKDLRVMGVSEKASPASIADYYQPFQKNLAAKTYPLRRDVYIISREGHPGLGGGLINYIVRDAGGLIIEKLGLWASKPYNREVYLTK